MVDHRVNRLEAASVKLKEADRPYLKLLSEKYPSILAASTAIVNLTAELNLPKGTEHFISDIHGEYEAFRHVIKNGSGSIKRKIEETFPTLSTAEKRSLATLIYYPEEKIPLILPTVTDKVDWYRTTLLRLLKLCRVFSSKYTRTRVRQFLPTHFADLIDELLHRQEDVEYKRDYYQRIIETIIATGSTQAFSIALAELIQRLAIATATSRPRSGKEKVRLKPGESYWSSTAVSPRLTSSRPALPATPWSIIRRD